MKVGHRGWLVVGLVACGRRQAPPPPPRSPPQSLDAGRVMRDAAVLRDVAVVPDLPLGLGAAGSDVVVPSVPIVWRRAVAYTAEATDGGAAPEVDEADALVQLVRVWDGAVAIAAMPSPTSEGSVVIAQRFNQEGARVGDTILVAAVRGVVETLSADVAASVVWVAWRAVGTQVRTELRPVQDDLYRVGATVTLDRFAAADEGPRMASVLAREDGSALVAHLGRLRRFTEADLRRWQRTWDGTGGAPSGNPRVRLTVTRVDGGARPVTVWSEEDDLAMTEETSGEPSSVPVEAAWVGAPDEVTFSTNIADAGHHLTLRMETTSFNRVHLPTPLDGLLGDDGHGALVTRSVGAEGVARWQLAPWPADGGVASGTARRVGAVSLMSALRCSDTALTVGDVVLADATRSVDLSALFATRETPRSRVHRTAVWMGGAVYSVRDAGTVLRGTLVRRACREGRLAAE